jgi:hypothetical protein
MKQGQDPKMVKIFFVSVDESQEEIQLEMEFTEMLEFKIC